MAVPVVESVASNVNSSGSSLTITKPTGTVEGDLLVAAVGLAENANFTGPSGWTFIRRDDNTSNINLEWWYKVAGASEPSNYTWSIGLTRQWSGGIWRISGQDGTTPIDANNGNNYSATQFPVSPSVTTTVDDCLVLRAVMSRDISTTEPGSHTNDWNRPSSFSSNAAIHKSQLSAGATGSATWTLGSSVTAGASTIAIAPAAASEFTATAALTIGGVEFSGSATFSPLTPPNAPSGLTATVDGSTINLAWTDNSSNESGFKIYRRRTP